MKVVNVEIPIYAETTEEAEMFRAAWVAFANELRNYGCLVTGEKLTKALPQWNSNILVKNRIVEHFKAQ